MTIRIALVDDNRLFREAMLEKLLSDSTFEIVGEGCSAGEAICIADRLHPDVMLLDISLSDMSGIDVMRRLTANKQPIKVIALSTYSEKYFVSEMLKAGAAGYLCKIDANDVCAAIRAVVRGDFYLSREVGGA